MTAIIPRAGSYARTVSRSFPQQGGAQYRSAPQTYNGGHALAEVERDTVAQEKEARIAHYEQMHQDLLMAKQRREEAEHQAIAQQKLRYEQMMATAIKKIGHINPADPAAEDKWNQVFQEHPELFHNEKGLPSLTPYYEQYQRLAASAQANREKQQAAVEAQKARQDEINQRHQESMDLRRELKETQTSSDDRRAKERNDDKRDARLEVARGKYETLTEKAADAKKEFDDTQAEIDRLKAKPTLGEEDKYHLDRMAVSLNKWKEKMKESEAQAKGLEKQFPELSPDYTPPEDKKSTPKASAAPPATDATDAPGATDSGDTAQPAAPAPVQQPAPVSGGTATPSGDMTPLGGTDTPAPAATAAPAVLAATPSAAPAEWDTLTEQMHRANAALDKAHARRNAAMDALAKMGPKEYLNPFSTATDDARKALDSANEEIDKHDAAYKEYFDKRGKLVKAAAPAAMTPIPAAVPAPDAPVASVPLPEAAPVAEIAHPYEGKRVRQKSTGMFGTFVNGQFVPEETEALADQPTPELSPTE